MRKILPVVCLLIYATHSLGQACFTCQDAPKGIIFCDDFEKDTPLKDRYFEYDDNKGDFIRKPGVGRAGSAGMQILFQKGEISAGSLKTAIGRNPVAYMARKATEPTRDFEEIYWRMDVRFQPGWQGGGADKLSRATSFVGSNWQQGFIAHIWSGKDNPAYNYLVLDPASGLDASGNIKSTKYNDFGNLRWLGAKRGNINLFSPEDDGQWHCVVAHVKLNTPGKADGIFELWLDGRLQAGNYNLNWHGTYNMNPDSYKINGIFFENYWNNGSPQQQKRYFDNIVISTQSISCHCSQK